MQKLEGADRWFGHQDGIRPGMEEKGVRMEVGYLERGRWPSNQWTVEAPWSKDSKNFIFIFLLSFLTQHNYFLNCSIEGLGDVGCLFMPLGLGVLNFSMKESGDLSPCTPL